MPQSQDERKAETRGRLLAAAAEMFAQQGYHAVSTDALAAAADRTSGAVYAHFGGKEGLLVALLEQWIEQTTADLAETLQRETDLDERLGALWAGVIRADSDSGDAWLLLEFELWLHAVRDPDLGAVGAERFRLMREGLAGGLADWSVEFGFALPAPTVELAAQVIALVIGAAFQFRLDPAVAPSAMVVSGLRRLLGLAGDVASPGFGAPGPEAVPLPAPEGVH